MSGSLVPWLPGCLASWLPGSLAPCRPAPLLPGSLAPWLPGFLAPWLPGGSTGPSGSQDVVSRSGPREAGKGPAGGSGGSRPGRPETHGTAATGCLGGGRRGFFRPPSPYYKALALKPLAPGLRSRIQDPEPRIKVRGLQVPRIQFRSFQVHRCGQRSLARRVPLPQATGVGGFAGEASGRFVGGF